jgi:LacI family transcriptional regulator
MAREAARRKQLVTVADVAAAAEVSTATAARALGGYGSVSAAVKERVLAAARHLEYRPNELARTMMTGRSGTIGVIVGDIENSFFGLAVRGATDCVKEAGFNVILANSGERIEEEEIAAQVLAAKQVDGLIVAPAMMGRSRHLKRVSAAGQPIALLDRELPGLDADVVLIDDLAAARAAVELLIRAGHRRVAYVTATAADAPFFRDIKQIVLSTVRNRIRGFLAAAGEAGLAYPEQYIRLGAVGHVASQRIITDLLTLPSPPTAILASDNVVALQVFRAARNLGLLIPRDLSLVAFHDADWTSATTPAVTVIAQPAYELGFSAATMLLERISGLVGGPRRKVLPTQLIERESVAMPPNSTTNMSPAG